MKRSISVGDGTDVKQSFQSSRSATDSARPDLCRVLIGSVNDPKATFESVSTIGILPFENVTLDRAYEASRSGMRQAHANLEMTMAPSRIALDGKEGLHFRYEWPSKSGLVVNESVRLIQKESPIYSIVSRTIEPVTPSINDTYDEMLPTFHIL